MSAQCYSVTQTVPRGRYNQTANFVLAQSKLAEQREDCTKEYGAIADAEDRRGNPRMSCLRESPLDGEIPGCEDVLEGSHKLSALQIKAWFGGL